MPAFLTRLGKLWRTLLADLDLYALVITGIIFAILGVSGIAEAKDLSSVTLACLTLLAFSQARTRRAMAAAPSTGRPGSVFMTDFPPELYERRSREGSDYIFVGVSGNRTISTGRRDFQNMLDRGGSLRFLLLDPEDEELLEYANTSGATSRKAERTRERVNGAVSELAEL